MYYYLCDIQYYDLAGVFEGFAIGPRPTPVAGDGWEINTGAFTIKRSAKPLLHKWLEVIKTEWKTIGQYLSGDQPGIYDCFRLTDYSRQSYA